MERHRVAIVIPAFNESGTIFSVVRAAQRFGQCIVVDDGSSDDTAVIAIEAGASVVVHARNAGYDSALNSGFAKAAELGCEVIVTLDADGQHDPSTLGKLLAHFEGGAFLVVGVRHRKQRIAEHVFGWYTISKYGLADPLCGLKAYRTELYKAMGHFDSYGSIGTELMLFAARRGYPIGRVEFTARDRKDRPRFANTLSANMKILRALYLSILRSK